jgi:anti-sigma factor RsiW
MSVTCDQFNQLMDSYLDKELGLNELTRFKRHLRSCKSCCLEFKSYDKSIHMMRNIFAEKDPPAAMKKKVFDKIKCCEQQNNDCCPPESNKS